MRTQQQNINNLNKFDFKTKSHFIELFISKKNIFIKEKVLNDILLKNKVLCNINKLKSVVFDKKQNSYILEQGFKIDIFSISDLNLIKLWFNFKKSLSINCLWINVDKSFYNGCICEYDFYKNLCEKYNLNKINCSEY